MKSEQRGRFVDIYAKSKAAKLIQQKNKRPAFLRALVLYGAGTRSRTRDLLITRKVL